MKRTTTLLLFAAASVLQLNSQVVLSEDFNAPFTLNATTGWTVQNNSQPLGSLGWFQGNGSVFSAFNGAPSDYYAANFNSTGTVSGVSNISNFLISPSVTIYNGAVIQFATRTTNSGTNTPIPDRLQLLMSQANTNVIPTGSASVGTFNTILLDINPNLTSNTTSAVSNGSVNGYPQSWTVYTVQISGVTGTVTGRFAFRYFVTNGGANGTNSDYIGVDAVRYTLPCSATVSDYTICAGGSATLNAMGSLPATTYSWSTGGTSSSVVVTPASTSVYSLYLFNGTVSCGNPVTSTVTIGSQLSFSIGASAQSVCPGSSVTLTAISAATQFSWNTGATTPVIVVNPTTATTYSVGGVNGFCFGGNTITINTLPAPSLSVASAPSVVCPGGTMNIGATGATSYIWVLGSSSATGSLVTVSTSTNPAGGTFTIGLIGTGSNGCSSSGVLTRTISPNPTVSAVVSTSVECINRSVTVTASGASTYTWSGASSSNSNPLAYSTGTVPGVKTFSVAGTDANGCTGNGTVSFSVSSCVGIEKINGNAAEAHVFPNPFNNELSLSGFEGRIEIYNSLGQLVISQQTNQEDVINTKELNKGTYILKAYLNDGNTRTVKLMKN